MCVWGGGGGDTGRTGSGVGGRAHAGVTRISCAKGTKMSKLKTSELEPDGAAEPTRPVGWLAERAACAPARHNPPGGGPLRGPAGRLSLLLERAREMHDISRLSQPEIKKRNALFSIFKQPWSRGRVSRSRTRHGRNIVHPPDSLRGPSRAPFLGLVKYGPVPSSSMAGLAPAEAMGVREPALRISHPNGAGPPDPDRANCETSGEPPREPGPRRTGRGTSATGAAHRE